MKPGTPLPWKCQGGAIYGHFDTTYPEQSPSPVPRLALMDREEPLTYGAERDQNAAYIAHAANAYPRLVEALEGLFANCAMVHIHWGEGDNTKEANAAIDAARNLLAELGE